jgi:hypothetical protein
VNRRCASEICSTAKKQRYALGMAKRLRLRPKRQPVEPPPPKTVWDVRLKSGATLRETVAIAIAILVLLAAFSVFYWWWVSVRKDHVIDKRDIDGIPFGIGMFLVFATPCALMMRRAYLNTLTDFKKLSSPTKQDTPQVTKQPRRSK